MQRISADFIQSSTHIRPIAAINSDCDSSNREIDPRFSAASASIRAPYFSAQPCRSVNFSATITGNNTFPSCW